MKISRIPCKLFFKSLSLELIISIQCIFIHFILINPERFYFWIFVCKFLLINIKL